MAAKLGRFTKKTTETGTHDSSASAPAGEAESTFHLIQRFRSGDTQALDVLSARHLPRLQRWAKGRPNGRAIWRTRRILSRNACFGRFGRAAYGSGARAVIRILKGIEYCPKWSARGESAERSVARW